ncbi:hypothetical protein GGS21DRAFT_137409 [Xylaria nigripes]|nr:hypothetical protein GGS21DRAFT_137409 [Xylaria nigripes]
MKRICKALFALALVASALAAPGPTPTPFSHHAHAETTKTTKTSHKTKATNTAKTTKTSKTSKDSKATTVKASHNSHVTTLHKPPPIVWQTTIAVDLPIPTEQAVLAPPATELKKREPEGENHNPAAVNCNPGDRICGPTLNDIQVCNDEQQWLVYKTCDEDSICHRLNAVCVRVMGSAGSVSPVSNGEGSDQCNPGDRRCSSVSNRVERCTDEKHWITYHDCHDVEKCDNELLECLPYTGDDEL